MLGFRHVFSSAYPEFVLNITASAVRPDIYTRAINAGWNGLSRLVVNITAPHINTIVFLGGYPGGRRLIIGAGSRIGNDRNSSDAVISVNTPIEIENRGQIWARGGNGGRGGSVTVSYDSDTATAGGGFGGSGAGYIDGTTSWANANEGEPGQVVGVGPSIGPSRVGYGYGGEGGQGGSPGQPGFHGSQATVSGTVHSANYTQPSTPGNAGVAILGNSHVTWIATGSVLGTRL